MEMNAAKLVTTTTAITSHATDDPACAMLVMVSTLPHRPENGGNPTTENAPAANTAATHGSRRARPDSRDNKSSP